MSCTDEQRHWNSGTHQNLAPKRLAEISFKHHKLTDDLPGTSAAVSQSLPPTPSFISHSELKKTLSDVPVGSPLQVRPTPQRGEGHITNATSYGDRRVATGVGGGYHWEHSITDLHVGGLGVTLCLAGHVVRMSDLRLPKQVFYGQLQSSTCSQGGQFKCYKDGLKLSLKLCNMDPNDLEEMVKDKTSWRAQCHAAIHSIELKWITAAIDKRRRQKLNPPNLTTSSQFMCTTCGRLRATRISLYSHRRTHQQQLPRGSLLHKCMSAEPVNLPAGTTQMQPHDDHGPDLQCHKCMSFYHTYVELMRVSKLNSLENVTKTQSASHVWRDARKLFHGNSSTRYGQENEELARAWIESTGYAVKKREMVVSHKEPWLSASPDGILNSSELLKIKCPLLSKNSTHLAELYSSTLSDLKIVDGIPQLQPKGSRGYYLQVQLGMFCTGLEKCKSLVWALAEQLVIDMLIDFQYCTEVISKLKSSILPICFQEL
ncbi:hypothetical protein H4Q32_013986 [Labeo rohita]|uniref:C2H2-type domain-containing protein n=1 Tax=Labeo rohita TaxID=84645 RepID=A0ABQ8LUN0_LABRO|nr:hypothetical protein H4Q32_013986 [Labeo rohita]